MNPTAERELVSAKYWDKRYADEKLGGSSHRSDDQYECFKTFEKLKPFYGRHLPPKQDVPKILQLGCGTSTLTADPYHNGYRDQVSIDFSSEAIETMKERYGQLGLCWKVMDVRNIDLPNAAFYVAIDKDPEEDVKTNVAAYVDEESTFTSPNLAQADVLKVARVLKPGSRWLYVTYRQLHFLKSLLARDTVGTVHVETL